MLSRKLSMVYLTNTSTLKIYYSFHSILIYRILQNRSPVLTNRASDYLDSTKMKYRFLVDWLSRVSLLVPKPSCYPRQWQCCC